MKINLKDFHLKFHYLIISKLIQIKASQLRMFPQNVDSERVFSSINAIAGRACVAGAVHVNVLEMSFNVIFEHFATESA